jgi:hypothetical protein
MNSASSNRRLWRIIAFAGTVLVTLGAVAGYVDVGSHFKFDFIDDYYDAIGVSMLIGVAFVFIGCIGYARYCSKQHRVLMAGLVLIAPWAALLVGSPIGGTNIRDFSGTGTFQGRALSGTDGISTNELRVRTRTDPRPSV